MNPTAYDWRADLLVSTSYRYLGGVQDVNISCELSVPPPQVYGKVLWSILLGPVLGVYLR